MLLTTFAWRTISAALFCKMTDFTVLLSLLPVTWHMGPLLNGFPHRKDVDPVESARALYPDLVGDDFVAGDLPLC